jgi:hypothetical protein
MKIEKRTIIVLKTIYFLAFFLIVFLFLLFILFFVPHYYIYTHCAYIACLPKRRPIKPSFHKYFYKSCVEHGSIEFKFRFIFVSLKKKSSPFHY